MKDLFAVLTTIAIVALFASVTHADDSKPSARLEALRALQKGSMVLDYLEVASSVEDDELKPYIATYIVNGDTIRIKVGVPQDAVPLDAPKTAMLDKKGK